MIYKLACLGVGIACVFMGYDLFMAGVLAPADLKAANGSANLSLANAAPGTFFALFGCSVIGLTIWRGLDVSAGSGDALKAAAAIPAEMPVVKDPVVLRYARVNLTAADSTPV
ncbi:MAG TPA: hypothetical protein VF459_10050 [Caulobacteraceae bacterium]